MEAKSLPRRSIAGLDSPIASVVIVGILIVTGSCLSTSHPGNIDFGRRLPDPFLKL